MKRTIFSVILVICLLLTLLPATLAQEAQPEVSVSVNNYRKGTVTVDGTDYSITTGRYANHAYVPWMEFHGLLKAQETYTANCYVLLRDSSNQDAPQAVYEAFWDQCQVTELLLSNGENTSVGTLTADADGYHKYFPVTFNGPSQGFYAMNILAPNSRTPICADGQNYNVLLAQPMTLENGTATATTENAMGYMGYAFSLDLGSSGSTWQISAELTGNRNGEIMQQDMLGGNYWSRRQGNPVYQQTVTISGGHAFFLVRPFESGDFTLSVTAQAEQPQLWCRMLRYDPETGSYYELPNRPAFPATELNFHVGDSEPFNFYFGTANDQTLLQPGAVTSEEPSILTITQSGTANFLYAKNVGTTALVYQRIRYPITIQAPTAGFFSQPSLSEDFYLSDVYWHNLPQADENLKEIWYLSEDWTADFDRSGIAVYLDDQQTDNIQWQQIDGGLYALKIFLPGLHGRAFYPVEIKDNGSRIIVAKIYMDISASISSSAAYVDDLVIGFSKTQNDGETITIEEKNGYSIGYGTSGSSGSSGSGYFQKEFLTISAARKSTEGTATVYTVDDAVTESLRITKLTITPITGDSSVFSLTQGAQTLVQKYFAGNTANVYYKSGLSSHALLTAEISGMIHGEPFTVTASTHLKLTKLEVSTEPRPSTDTVEALNQLLQDLANSVEPNNEAPAKFWIALGNTTYDGTIVIPKKDGNNRTMTFSFQGRSSTVINGGIDLNDSYTLEHVYDIHFTAPETEAQTRAIWNGTVTFVSDCTFRGYDIALDSSVGLINAAGGNVFMDNQVAISADLQNARQQYSKPDWTHNTFLCNGTAVEILSLPTSGTWITPYYFRFMDSNFIGNETDFDIRVAGRFYMYRNYYAKVHSQSANLSAEALYTQLQKATSDHATQQLVTSNSPEISANNSKTKVITNPRWKYPVRDALKTSLPTAAAAKFSLQGIDTPYENYLTADWNLDTEILNGEAADLAISAAAFAVSGEKTVDILQDQTEKRMGTWTFPEQAASPVLLQSETTDFLAGLTVTRKQETIIVTVEDTAVLAQYSPTLTIPDAGKVLSVTLEQQSVAFTAKDGAVTFPVSKGGSYVIEIGAPDDVTVKAEAVDDPQTPGKVLVPVSLQSNALTKKNCTVIVSAYDENRQMQDVAVSDAITLQPGQTDSCTLTLTNCPANAIIRVFVVDGNTVPLTTVPPIS